MRAQDGPVLGEGGATTSLLSISLVRHQNNFLRKLFLAISQRLENGPFPGESIPESSPEVGLIDEFSLYPSRASAKAVA